MADRDDDLAYGEYHGQRGGEDGATGDRGFLGDTFRRFAGGGKSRPPGGEGQPNVTQSYQPHLYNQGPQQSTQAGAQQQPSSASGGGGGMSSFFDTLHSGVHQLGSQIKHKIAAYEQHSHTDDSGECHPGAHDAHSQNRYMSFAPQRPEGNDVKWYVDACGYMYAVSKALEQARETIWILDWWLSPELYLRRPPAKNEQYRIDRMLKAAAERGVKVNVIVYKEVTQALTLSSSHTKHALEDLHPNICVFRHPDHLPDKQNMAQDFIQGIQNLKLTASTAASLPGNTLAAIYGSTEDTVLYWAHHEKLCLIDGHTAFMGGLDLCYGRWDTNQHSIADAHPGNLDDIVFPGQDFNNSRVMDFQDVVHWQNNKLDRTQSSRMGWTDLSICMSGPICGDLKEHFVQRWNMIFEEKYRVRKDTRYSLLTNAPATLAPPGQQGGPQFAPPPGQRGFDEGEGESERGFFGGGGDSSDRGRSPGGFREKLKYAAQEGYSDFEGSRYGQKLHSYAGRYGLSPSRPSSSQGTRPTEGSGFSVQLARSCAKWSHGGPIEHSIANAYIDVIKNSEHFVYIENQFFITATSNKQRPIKNKIGAAIVDRILRAARNGQKWKMIVIMPAVPAFAGDLQTDEALSTRAIMEFQYNSINRGGDSIYETIARAGFNPMEYIRFYNLRNYDRINASAAMQKVEQASGVKYEDARKQFDEQYGGGFGGDGSSQSRGGIGESDRGAYPGQPEYGSPQQQNAPQSSYQAYHPPGSVPPPPQPSAPVELPTDYQYPPPPAGGPPQQGGYGDQPQYAGQKPYQEYQQEAAKIGGPMGSGRWDSVAECYMLNGEDIRNVPWEGGNVPEIDAFVSEELYVHSKLLIADDRIVICGSANLNDRSQLGDHDSEIAVIIEDHHLIDSTMNGRPWKATKFAATLRREIFKKHLGLLPAQDIQREQPNYLPVGIPNEYEFGTEADRLVADPLDDNFLNHWNNLAHTNTEVFGKVFHPVPHDNVKTWKDYDEWYSKYFRAEDPKDKSKPKGKYKVGHVVSEDFPGGVQEVKDQLSRVKGTLVEMPLLFLKGEDIAKEGLGLNAFTEEVYT